MKTRTLCFVLTACLALACAAHGGEIAANYVKTLGVLTPDGSPLPTAVGKVAIDEEGNIYCGTPHGGSLIQKLTPEGRPVWRHFHNIPGFQGVAVDEKYVYTCGSGYYNWRYIQRFDRASGQQDKTWEHLWKPGKLEGPSLGVEPFKMPTALLVDDTHLYVMDSLGDAIRRLNKETGAEEPFAMPVNVVKPVDMAWMPNGNMLVLTSQVVAELNKKGEPVRIPVVDKLSRAVAVDVHPKTGNIWVAEGGPAAELVNRIREYTQDGKATGVEIGMGGAFNGKWSPSSFAFADGSGDFAFDADGSVWVNPGWSWRVSMLPALHHFTPAPEFKCDKSFTGISTRRLFRIAVDEELSVYTGAPYKISWDNEFVWTSGLVENTTSQYPKNIVFWPVFPAYGGGLVANVVSPSGDIYTLRADRGMATGKRVNPRDPKRGLGDVVTVGEDLYVSANASGVIYHTTVSLEKPFSTFFTPPADTDLKAARFALSADLGSIYYSTGKKQYAYRVADGAKLWEGDGGHICAAHKGFLFTNPGNVHGKGIVVRDAADGTQVALIGGSPVGERQALGYIEAMAIGSKDGVDYLFVLCQSKVSVYRLAIAE